MFTVEDALIKICENNGGRVKFHGDLPKVFHNLPEVSRSFNVQEMFIKDSVKKDRDKDIMVYGIYSDPGLNHDLLCVNDSQSAMWDVYDSIDESHIKSLGSLVNDMEPRVGPMHLMDFVIYTANSLKLFASDSKELINDSDMGYVAPGFCWDKELDFKIAEWPDFKGLRYKDFETSRAIKVELIDGKTYSLGKHHEQMGNLSNGFSRFIRHVRNIYDYMHSCYSFADVTNERVGGKLSEDFAGPVTWSKALDFDVKDWPEFKGIRYIDFKDCTNVHFLQKNDESIPMEKVPYKRLNQVYNAMKYRLAQSLGMLAMAIDKNTKYEPLKDDKYLLMKETACKSEQLQAYFGGEKYVREVFRRFEEMFPVRGVNQIPYLRDGAEVGPTEDVPSAVKRDTERLARSVFPEMPFNDSYKAILFLNENLERIGGIQYRSYSGCVIDPELKVPVPEGSVDMGHFEMNGKIAVVRECSSMYDNNVIIGGDSIMKFGPYCCPVILSIPDTSHSGDKYDVCVIHSSHGMSGVDNSKTYDVFSDGGDVLIPLVENAQVLTEHGELRVVKGGKEYDYSIPMLKDMAAKLRAGRLDKLEAEGVGRYFHIVNIQRAYDLSVKTDEVIGGRFAEYFAGKVSWSRALDMDLKDFPDVRGIRYIDFKDCTNVHVLFKDGESLLTDLASPKLLKAISAKVDEMRQSPKRQLKSGGNKIK